jgi:hypothetical protein
MRVGIQRINLGRALMGCKVNGLFFGEFRFERRGRAVTSRATAFGGFYNLKGFGFIGALSLRIC